MIICNVSCAIVEADAGDIGGSLSHEYLVPCDAGEGKITHCSV